MTGTWPSVMCTGHRTLAPAPARWAWRTLRAIVADLPDQHGTREAICGMALGADQTFGFAALAAGMRLAAYIPYPQQAERWHQCRAADWNMLRRCADPTRERVFGDLDSVVEDDRRALAVRLLHARNDGMITDADAAVVVWDGRRKGGTWSAVQKLRRTSLPVVWLDVARQQVHTGPARDVLDVQVSA